MERGGQQFDINELITKDDVADNYIIEERVQQLGAMTE